MNKISIVVITLFFFIVENSNVTAQNDSDSKKIIDLLIKQNEALQHRLDVLEKMTDDVLWYNKVGDVAFVDKIFHTGPPLWKEKNPDGQGAGNPVKIWSYVFIPKNAVEGKKYPLMVLPHGGVHASFDTYYTHIIRELVAQGYIVIANDYRGSTGYGSSMYRKIDYGGLETEDVFASKQVMCESYDIVDSNRVGIMGWSHGGLIALFNIFDHPNDYKAAFAGVPVSDVIARMGYKDQAYRDLYSADYHIGQSADQNVEEYRRRSPAWNTHKMKDTPLLIHTNTNDEDVNVLEVEHLIKSLKADGKKFEYEIFNEIPGGHSFDRMDSQQATEIRFKIYKFLNARLNPPTPFKSVKEMRKAAYRF